MQYEAVFGRRPVEWWLYEHDMEQPEHQGAALYEMGNELRPKAGIDISARIPLEAPITPHNKRYLTTKAMRSGHKFVTLKASPNETS